MNKEELQKKCANLIGVSASEKELAFEVLQDKILDQLKNDSDAIRIKELGVFQFKVNNEDNTCELIFSPTQMSSVSRTLFLRLPVKRTSSNNDTNIDDIFSLSVGKPIVPLTSSYEAGESDTSFVFIKKKIEERVNEILSEAEFVSNFNLWDDYLESLKKDEPQQSDSSALLHDLTEPETEPEEEELDPFAKSNINGESDFYSFPVEEEQTKSEVDDFFDDFETFKNLSEHEEKPDEEFFSDEIFADENGDKKEKNGIDEIIDEEDKQDLSKEDTFDIDEAVFNSVSEDDKVDWSWGDELKSEIPEEEPPVIKPAKSAEDEETSRENKSLKSDDKFDDDPFGTLEKTLEMDPEFRRLSGEYSFDEIETGDREYRITNLSKPREVPPKPKTRITRLTSLAEEPRDGKTPTDISEKESVYKSFRERNSNSNVFVIAGIIVILVVIIYFAFSMNDEPPKDVIKPSSQTAQAQPEENIVTTEPPVSTQNAVTPQTQEELTTSAQPDNSSKVEEIRISNLIFRRGNEYNVQVSSWRSAIKADAEVKRLKAKGYNAFVVQAYLPSKGGTWHRVRVGGFKSEEQARNFLNNTQL